MKLERVQAVVLTALLVIAGLFVFQAYELRADPVPKTIFGQVNPNSTTGAIAFPGTVVFYIQNRTSEQKDFDIMYQSPPPTVVEYYGSPIEDTIIDWEPGDPGIVVVNVEHGTYAGGDRVGYVAYSSDTLDNTGSQTFPTVELQKIPVPQIVGNDTTYINMSWTPLPDPLGLIAGYKVYRSDTNASDLDWALVPGSGTVNAPLTTNYFNDTSVSAGATYYYSIKVCFWGWVDEPSDMTVDNYQNQYWGEGSGMMETPAPPVGIDYIVIMDAPGGTGNPIWENWPNPSFTLYNVGENDTYWACGFNNSLGYVQDVVVIWSTWDLTGNPDTKNGTVTPGPSESTTFTANSTHGGALIVRAESIPLGLSNITDIIVVIPPQPDYIQIRDAPNNGGSVVTTMTYGVAEVDQFYAAGYNYTAGYIGEVEVDWVCDDTSVGTVDPLGTMTNFTAQWVAVDSTCTVNATYAGTVTNVTGLLTVLYPRIDEIQIRTQDFGGGIDLSDPANYPLYQKGYTTTFYGAQYNNSIGYIGSVSLTSTWTSNDTSIVDVTSPGNQTAVTCDPVNTGWVWVNLTDGVHQASTIVTVSDITVDYILIRDAPGGGGNNLCDPVNYTSYPVGEKPTFYGAAYNYSVGYFKDVDALSTWVTSDGTIVAVESQPSGPSCLLTCSNTIWGTVTITLTDFATGKQNTTQVTVLEPTVDYIRIMDQPGGVGSVITTMEYWVWDTDDFYAAAYNYTADYLYDVSATWSSDDTTVGQVTSPADPTTFTAQWVTVDSTCTVTATFGGVTNQTGLLTVLYPRIDYIQIRDTAGGVGSVITTMEYWVWETDDFYAAAYNDTVSYMYDVSATWSSDDTTVGQVTSPADPTTFTAQWVTVDSTCTVTATYNGITNQTGLLTVLYPRVAYIQIRDTAGGLGNVVTTMEYWVWDTDDFYAAAYNDTVSYLYDVSATWSSDDTTVGQVTTPADPTTFTAQWVTVDSTCTVTATFGGITNQTGLLTVLYPRADYIQIRDTAGGLGNVVTTMEYWVWDTDDFYAAAYNLTVNYLYDVSATWSSDDTTVGQVTSPADPTTFTAQLVSVDSTCTVTATFGGVTNQTGLLTVLYPRVDYIQIRDTAGGVGNVVTTMEYWVWDTDDFYAAAYNNTADYLYDVSATWSSDDTTVGQITSPADPTTFSAQWVTVDSTCTVTATYSGITNQTGLLTVLYPRVVYIQIRDTAGGLGNIVTTATYNALDTDEFYTAAYNDTVNYLDDVEVAWQSDAPSVGSVDPLGIWTNFTAQQILVTNTCTITATYMGTISNTTGLLTVLGSAPPVDYIIIRDESNNGGNVVTTATYSVWETDEFYCAAYDSGDVYLFDVVATWVSDTISVGQVTTPGHWTNFTAQWVDVDSTCIVTATYGSLTDTTGDLTVLYPRVDEIMIRDAANGLGEVVITAVYEVNDVEQFYAAAYNDTVKYLDDVEVDWLSSDSNIGTVDDLGIWTNFTAQKVATDSTCTVTATYGTISNVTGDLTVLYPRVDDIIIRDAPDDGGFPLGMEFFWVGNTSTYYAAAYNDTIDYLGDLAGAEWDVTDGIGTVSPTTGASSTFTATTEGTGTITISYTYDGVTVTDDSGTIYVYALDEPPAAPGLPTLKIKGKDKAELTWPANTETDLVGYIIYRSTDPDDPTSWLPVGATDNATTTFTDEGLDPDTKYSYRITAVDQIGQESPPSEIVSGTTEPEDEFPWIWLILFIIIAIVVLLLILFLWKKKKEEEALPPEAAVPGVVPTEEAPMEEYEEVPSEEYEEYEEAPSEEYEEYEEAPGEEYEEIEYEEEEPETPPSPPPPPPPP